MADEKEYQLVTVKRKNGGVVPRARLKGSEIQVKSYFEVEAGDFLISKRQVVHGANGIVPSSLDKAIVSNEYLSISGNDHISTKFWALISRLPSMYKQYMLSSFGIDIEKLVFDIEDWKKRCISIPSSSEQECLIDFFAKLDDLITLHQRKPCRNLEYGCGHQRAFVACEF